MFAVPGWSVSADNLKAEKIGSKSGDSASNSKKRKRPGDVNASNVGTLWGSVVEGRDAKPTKRDDKSLKRQKKIDSADAEAGEAEEDNKATDETVVNQKKTKKEKKEKKRERKEKKRAQEQPNEADEQTQKPTESAAEPVPELPPAPPKLTPLQAAMREKLISARFRHLNETLYTRPSEESFSLFQDSPEMFSEYHEGFRQQVKVWPENPVDSFLRDIRTRGKVRQPPKGKPGSNRSAPLSATYLPRTAGVCTIADLGCGDAALAASLQADKSKLSIHVKSYDLQSPSPLVTKADIANLPLNDGDINVAIFCLALMGTNWIDFIEEAYRILHWKGELWVAEIKSRFGPVRNKHAPVEHSVGHRRKNQKKGKAGGADPANHTEDLAVEVDGADDRRRETDVSAFVEALKKRGFVLNGETKEAIDLSNKMFVKMRFIKGASPTKGKNVTEQQKDKGKKKMFAPKQGEEDGADEVNEAAILKPCVYKIR